MAFQIPLDIYNRALQHLGRKRIFGIDSPSEGALEIQACYDKLRDAELRRNVWRFSIRKTILRAIDSATVIWTPPTWSATTTYALGAVVAYTPPSLNSAESGANPIPIYWQVDQAITGAAGNPAPDVATYWHRYTGPITADPFVPAAADLPTPSSPTLTTTAGGSLGARTEYFTITYVGPSGETAASPEASISIAANSLAKVTSPPAATGATGYNVYASATTLTEGLQNASPITIGTDWTEPTTGLIFGQRAPTVVTSSFFAGDLVTAGGTVYLSLISNNTDDPPTPNWLNVGGTTKPLQLVYPIGTGPVRNSSTLNVFRLPYGFLKRAPEDPAAGKNPYLGAPRELQADDWVLEGEYLVSQDTGPLMLRYQADLIDVYLMDPMFCEALSAKIAKETGPVLADPKHWTAILANVNAHYRDEISEARTVNGIEVGSAPPPEDDFITCRF